MIRLLALSICLAIGIAVQATAENACTDCHTEEGGKVSPQQALSLSSHKDVACQNCHDLISGEGSGAGGAFHNGSKAVNCGICHEQEAAIYKTHGRLQVGTNPDIPKCSNCHGTHDILPASDRESHIHPANLPSTCRTCHTDVDLVKKHQVLRDQPIKLYQNSVHGKAPGKGIYSAAKCNDCHSAKGPNGEPTSHRILSAADPQSPINHFSLPDTCGRCHVGVAKDYWEGIHGQLVKRGSIDAPVCNQCHGEHGIISPGDARSPVSSRRLAEKTCVGCHESPLLSDKYGVGRVGMVSYIDAYHGMKSASGDSLVANCASCHGSHRILPSSDPTSSIAQKNLQTTCGECHPAISAELAQTKIHEIAKIPYSGWPGFFQKFYLLMITVTIGLMVIHNLADWARYLKEMRRQQMVRRFTVSEVLQHWILMLSFIVLVISGFSLRFSEAAWVKVLFGWKGGFEMRGEIHRFAAIVLIVGTIVHLFYLFTKRGKESLREMMPDRRDVTDVKENIRYFLDLRPAAPRFRRFSYIEKAEYWALVWGTVIMIITGLMLWFDNFLLDGVGLSKVVIDVASVVHYYEAWLAFLAILVWHIYGTVLKPGIYPMNPAWLTGWMPKGMYEHEHLEDPVVAVDASTPEKRE